MAATRKRAATTKAKKTAPAKKAPPPKTAPPPRATSVPLSPAPPAPPSTPASPATPASIDHAARIAEAWRRLEAFAASIGAPPLALEPPPTKKAIAEAEKTMGLSFPPDFRASLLLHDGQSPGARAFPWMPGCAPLAPLARVVELWTKHQKQLGKKARPEVIAPTARVKPGVVRAGRIPIADGTFLDLDPGPAGVAGQLLTIVNHDVVVIDTSFGAALERWASVLERGLWVYDPVKHAVLPKAAPLFDGNPAGLFSKR